MSSQYGFRGRISGPQTIRPKEKTKWEISKETELFGEKVNDWVRGVIQDFVGSVFGREEDSWNVGKFKMATDNSVVWYYDSYGREVGIRVEVWLNPKTGEPSETSVSLYEDTGEHRLGYIGERCDNHWRGKSRKRGFDLVATIQEAQTKLEKDKQQPFQVETGREIDIYDESTDRSGYGL